MKRLLNGLLLVVALLTMGAQDGCQVPTKRPEAAPTGNTKGLPGAIAAANTASGNALASATNRAATAAASVAALRAANTNQPPGPATDFVDAEAGLALGSLPAPDAAAALLAEQRRAAMFAGQRDEARRLYAAAQTETERLKAKADADERKATEAAAALMAAERAHAAALEKNRAENQAKLDAATKAADEAKEKAYKERQNLVFYILCGIGGLCIIAGIGLAIATSGASIGRSSVAVGCGAVCFGLAKVISHPWFNTIFAIACVLAAAALGYYLWSERKTLNVVKAKDAALEAADEVKATAAMLVKAIDETGAAVTAGTKTPLGTKLTGEMDKAHKLVVRKLRLENERAAP